MSHFCDSRFALFVCLLIVACATPAALAGPSLDIRPSICPNFLDRDGNTSFAVALVGDPDFIVSRLDIDFASLRLTRADGVGGSVRPMLRPRSRKMAPRLIDVAAPRISDMCSTFGADGIRDLKVRFGQYRVVRRLELGTVPLNTTVELCLSGQTGDGTPFDVCDDVIIISLALPTSLEDEDGTLSIDF